MKGDLRIMKINNWTKCLQDRVKGKEVVERGRTVKLWGLMEREEEEKEERMCRRRRIIKRKMRIRRRRRRRRRSRRKKGGGCAEGEA